MGDWSILTRNEISIQINEELTESVITINENEPNPTSGLNSETYWKKKYEELNVLYMKREQTYDSVLKKCNKFNNTLKKKWKDWMWEKNICINNV